MNSIGEKIKLLREAKGLSQRSLAKRASISQPTVSDYESGIIKQHRVHVLSKIAYALDVNINNLTDGEVESPQGMQDIIGQLNTTIQTLEKIKKMLAGDS